MLFCILILLLIFTILAKGMHKDITYPAGIDTIDSFGDGTYQLLSGEKESLYNFKYSSCIIPQVKSFRVVNEKVYLTGTALQSYTDGKSNNECVYELYAVIELHNNSLTLCAVSAVPSDPEIYIYRLEEMIENGDMQLLSDFSDFSNVDQSVFAEFSHFINSN